MTILSEAKKQLSDEAHEYKVRIARDVLGRIEAEKTRILSSNEKLDLYARMLKDLEHLSKDSLKQKYGSIDL